MVKITKVYTKTGDAGETHLARGKRVKKSSVRIEAIGSVDELNAYMGWLLEAIKAESVLHHLIPQCERIQQTLFNLGSQLAVLVADRRENTPVVTESQIELLEKEIDEINADLPMLKSFILPGGGEVSSRFHICRAVCRRAERETLRLQEVEHLDGTELVYLNRLSDWLFVYARYVAKVLNHPERLWMI